MTQDGEKPEVSPADQYQIGDLVVYKPVGVITEITGYLWNYSIAHAPALVGYNLSCGISVSMDMLRHATDEESKRIA